MFWIKLKMFFGNVGDFLMPFVKIFISQAGQILMNTALKVVMDIAKDPSLATDQAKRDAAFQAIMADLKAKGITLGTSTINAAIEAAVQKIKESQG